MKSAAYALMAIVAFGACTNATAEQKPLWELGLGAAVLDGPDYRGAEGRSTWVLPFPYVVYRGKVVRAEENTVRGLLHKSDRLEINVSVGGATPVNSDSADAREDMPDLDPALEIGPSVNYTLAGSEHGPWELQVRLPVRAVISGNSSSIDYRGVVANPNISFDAREWLGHGWRFGMSIGPVLADEKNHAYYYDVKAKYATPERPEYHTSGGYSGMRTNMAVSNRIGDVWVGGFVRYDNIAGADFAGSPLVGRENGVSVGLAFAVIFKKSARMVEE